MADTKIMFTYNFIAPLRSALQVIFLRKTHKSFLKSSIEPCFGIKIKLVNLEIFCCMSIGLNPVTFVNFWDWPGMIFLII